MIATVTKRRATFGDEHYAFQVFGGMEVEVYNENDGTVQVQYLDPEGTLHVAYNVDPNWLANIVVYRRAKDLGYGN